MTTVKKAVIPAAGLGVRFLPVTKSMPKEMLPIIDKPVIHYVVEEAIDSGIDDIIIITGWGKRAIEDYFAESPELDLELLNLQLMKNDRHGILKNLTNIASRADIHYIRQKSPHGLGDAVLHAKKHIGDEPFAVLLGDDIMKDTTPCTKQLIRMFERTQSSVIAVQEVAREKISSYGIVKGKQMDTSLFFIEDIIEKPKVQDAPSNLGAIGRYVFTPELFECLAKTVPGVGNEIQLTDAIRMLIKKQHVYAYTYWGKRYDTGDKLGYIETIIDFALNNKQLKEPLREFLETVMKK